LNTFAILDQGILDLDPCWHIHDPTSVCIKEMYKKYVTFNLQVHIQGQEYNH